MRAPPVEGRAGMGSRVRCATSVLCACALLGGCGDDGGGASSATAPAAAAASAPITIARPLDGSRVRATRTPRGRLRARTKASGRASPGGSVFLSASCRPVRCKARATAGADGRWSASMTLTTTAAATFVTIDASSQARVSSTGSAVTTVELAGPRVGSGAGDGGASASGAGDGGASASASGTRRRAAAPPPSAPPPSAGPALPHDVLVIGDSLAVGMADYLRAALPGWRVRIDGKISRPLAVGMRILAQEPDVPAIVAMSLFTNDDPSATAALEQAVRATATRPGGCAVWATIVRPPYNGVSYDAANRVLVRLGSRLPGLRLADWAGAVAQSPSFVGGDGVHATPEGYRARGELYAAAIRQCAGEG